MMAAALNGLVNKYDLKGQTLGDVALGAVIKHSRDWNLARESVLDSGLSQKTPGMDLQRACGTSLEACAIIANKCLSAHSSGCLSRALIRGSAISLVSIASQSFQARAARCYRATNWFVDGRKY
jgi:hypothetical protein